ncbi:hypothetical protein IID24_04750 [Patescibacteria group bacterium]|nr:hypothetical protein [Patescibacteria group bacterium]
MFPEKIQGVDPIGGQKGADAPASDLNTGFQSTSDLDTIGNGVPLVEYRGQLMSHEGRQRLIDDDKSLREAQRHEEVQDFLGSVGTR